MAMEIIRQRGNAERTTEQTHVPEHDRIDFVMWARAFDPKTLLRAGRSSRVALDVLLHTGRRT